MLAVNSSVTFDDINSSCMQWC